ncbi:MAG: hypothetical protein M3395_08945 [Chloroflexota bacterium]|nr:hypothetical protein [Chloroflexota bacterium]
MATRSTASSSTDPEGRPPSDQVDLGRRSFFRHFGRSALLTAGQVAGAAGAVRRSTAEAASALLDPLETVDAVPAPARAGMAVTAAMAGYRSPYRLDGDTLLLLDQRELPDRLDLMACHDGRDVTRAIRLGTVRGGGLLAQVAAYGVALTAQRHRERPPSAIRAELDADMASLRRARPSARALAAAMDRMSACVAAIAPDADAATLARESRREADAIASEAMLDHAALVGHGVEWLPRPERRPLHLLLHGASGPMANGMIGTALGIVQRSIADERAVHAWVTEGRPTGEGARITTWELDHIGVPHTVLPDAAVGWLLRDQPPDAILLSAEWLAANGDAAVFAGGGAIAALAFGHTTEAVPVLLCAPSASFDSSTADGADIPRDLRGGREAGSLMHPGTPPGTQVIDPAVDVALAQHLSAIATAAGIVRPPFGPGLARAMSEAGVIR